MLKTSSVMLIFLYVSGLMVTLHAGFTHESSLNNKKFPRDFSFGAATSAYQIEGAWNADGKSASVWDNHTHAHPDYVIGGSNADVSCDSYHKYKEDVALLKAIGVNHYRFSIAWTRILPTGRADRINEAGVTYYKNLIRELKSNGIRPMVTLYHGDFPQALKDKGGPLSPLFPRWFAEYARVCFTLFGDDVQYWLTINEPLGECSLGSLSFGPADGVNNYVCALRYLAAHAAAWHLYDEEFRGKQHGKVAMVLNSLWFEPASDIPADITAAETLLQFTLGWFAHPLYHGDWPEIMKTRIAMRSKLEGFNQSRLPELTPKEKKYIKGTNDFFALNTYSSAMAQTRKEPEISTPSFEKDVGQRAFECTDCRHSAMPWMQFTPWGTRKLLKWIKDAYDSPDIMITENGWNDATGQLDDDIREKYIKEYLSNVRDAMVEDGVKVFGYTLWSIIDNFEWTSGYSIKFGTVQVDFNSPNRTRTRKNSSFYYESVCKTHCLVKECNDRI